MLDRQENPFSFGKIASGQTFINREDTINLVLDLVSGRTSHSVAIVGVSHSGKSSLVRRLAEPQVRRAYLGEFSESILVSFIDAHLTGAPYTPVDFWKEALRPILTDPQDDQMTQLLRRAKTESYATFSVKAVLSHLETQGRRLLVLIDEFDALLANHVFHSELFFSSLRSLTLSTELAVICASRSSVSAMNAVATQKGHEGSPAFNHLYEHRLEPFDQEAIVALLALGGNMLSEQDNALIREFAGPSPYLLQAIAWHVYRARLIAQGNKHLLHATYTKAIEQCYQGVSSYFDEIWKALNDQTRTVAIMLCLEKVDNRVYNQLYLNELDRHSDRFAFEMRELRQVGLACVSKTSSKTSQLESWHICSAAFVLWVKNTIFSASPRVEPYEQWLQNKRYNLLLTEEEWRNVQSAFGAIKDIVADAAGVLLKSAMGS